MVASNEVEESICRLAQMARRRHPSPFRRSASVDVTGLIKANLPSRISFRVSSKIDSRTILDGNGAEQLLGKGDMLSCRQRLLARYVSRSAYPEQESPPASFLRRVPVGPTIRSRPRTKRRPVPVD